MNNKRINYFLSGNAGKFDMAMVPEMKLQMERMDETQWAILNGTSFMDTTLILVIAIFFGWERFFIGDVAMGVLKVITCYGLGVWWLVDIFTAVRRTQEYNYQKFMSVAQMAR